MGYDLLQNNRGAPVGFIKPFKWLGFKGSFVRSVHCEQGGGGCVCQGPGLLGKGSKPRQKEGRITLPDVVQRVA